MDEHDIDDHEEDTGRLCENGDGAPASIERNKRWICTDCDMRESGTGNIND